MALFADGDAAFGINKLLDYGVIGLFLCVTLWTLKIVAFRYSDVLVNGRTEARADLVEERKARQAHEQQMATLLGELVKTNAEQKETMEKQKDAIETVVNLIAKLLEEFKRLKGPIT